MLVTLALFGAGIAMGVAGALVWAWGVHSGQFRDLEETKAQLFWPDLAPEPPALATAGKTNTRREDAEDR